MEINIVLEGQSFTDSPTKTQTINALQSIERFLNQIAGAQLLKQEYLASQPEMQNLLNASVLVKKAAETFSGTSGLAVPQGGPQIVR